jgi:uncharacterized protein (DUF58 family)
MSRLRHEASARQARLRDDVAAGQAHAEEPPLVSLADITEIELILLRRLREVTLGDHRSTSPGSGFDLVGLREWQAGDRLSAIDWAQSSLTDFSQLMVREFDQPSTATVMTVADRSLSMRCGAAGAPIAAACARAIATIGLSASFFQDLFGMMTFDDGFREFAAIRPRVGRNQVVHCLDAYQYGQGLEDVRQADSLSRTIASFTRRTALVPFLSDFLFEHAERVLRELALLASTHDTFVVMLDAADAFTMPRLSAGWLEIFDVETGRARMISRAEAARMSDRVRAWQNEVATQARELDIDLVRVGPDTTQSDLALAEFVAERRLRKVM